MCVCVCVCGLVGVYACVGMCIKRNLEYLRVPSLCSLYCDVTCISLVRS